MSTQSESDFGIAFWQDRLNELREWRQSDAWSAAPIPVCVAVDDKIKVCLEQIAIYEASKSRYLKESEATQNVETA